MSRNLTCIAIDDEFIALKIVTTLIEQTGFLDLLGAYQDAHEGTNAIIEHEPDVVFLDIQMPEISGLDIIASLHKKPEIILVTSQSKYAAKAFEFDVTDYLVKPIEDYPRFMKAVQKAKNNINLRENSTQEDEAVFMKIDSLLTKIDYSDILFVEGYGDYVKVYTPDKVHVIYSKLGTMENKLPKDKFLRIHRSYIIQIKKVTNIDQNSLQIGEKVIPVSSTLKPKLLKKIKLL